MVTAKIFVYILLFRLPHENTVTTGVDKKMLFRPQSSPREGRVTYYNDPFPYGYTM